MVTFPLVVALALGAVEGLAEGSSSGGVGNSPEAAQAARPVPRLHFSIAGVGAFATAAIYSGGVGATGDVGVVLDDRFSLFAHASAVTLGLSFVGHFGAMFEYHFGERFSVGAGVAYASWLWFFPRSFWGAWSGILFPVRVALNLAPRGLAGIPRSGAFVALQVSPGLSTEATSTYYPPRPYAPEFGMTFALSVGFAMR